MNSRTHNIDSCNPNSQKPSSFLQVSFAFYAELIQLTSVIFSLCIPHVALLLSAMRQAKSMTKFM